MDEMEKCGHYEHWRTDFELVREMGICFLRAVNWLWKEWANVLRVRNDGIPVVGFTWYSLTDQMDWDTALREENNRVNPLGLYDLRRKIRPVGEAYRRLIADWCKVLPTQSVCLRVPVVMPSEHNEGWARRRREQARSERGDAPTAPAIPDQGGR